MGTHKYHTFFDLQLRDGTEATFRQIMPSDKYRLKKALEYLSAETVYKRFFTPIKHFSQRELEYLTEVDQSDHVAWGCLSSDYPKLPGLGLGRFVRLKEDPKVAEFAITILDDLQKKGLGTMFLALLVALAPYHQIENLMGYVLSSNREFLDMLKQIGEVHHESGGVNRVLLPVDQKVIEKIDNRYAEYFREAYDVVKEKLNKSAGLD